MPPTLTEAATHEALDAVLDRVDSTLAQVGDAFPYYADSDTGEWETTPDGDWCGGHWVGLLWLAFEHADRGERDRYARVARDRTETLVENLPPDTMFRGMNLHYAGFRAYDATGDRSAFGIGMTGADDTRAAFDERSRQIPLGEFQIRGPENFRGEQTAAHPPGSEIGAVDAVYTALPVLWRAYRETGDPRFHDVAISHADRHLDWYLRPDGSTWHHAVVDSETGGLERRYNELAFSDETCWARGQGWNVAGLARAYRETGAARYRAALERSMAYYRDNAPADLVPHWDFEAPDAPDAVRDTSAAALAAYGLSRLPADDDRVADFREMGERILGSLVDDYLVTEPGDRRGAVLHGCYNRPGDYAIDNELIWTAYYVGYALHASLADGVD